LLLVFTRFHRRASVVSLVAALTLTAAGVVALPFQPTSAGADGLPPAPVDFAVSPGQSLVKVFTGPKLGSAELRPDPDGCRNDPAIGLTCGAHRIKITQPTPGYFLRIRTAWIAQGQQVSTSVPDVDTYLFAVPDSAMDYNQIGGVSGAMPEVIKVEKPAQSEYDFVVGVYAGAIHEYAITVSYVNEAVGPTPLKVPDLLLRPGDPPIVKTVNSPMVGYTGQPGFYALVKQEPDACRTDPTKDILCDVYRIKLDRNRSPEATNFVLMSIDFASTKTPDLPVGVAGVSGLQNPNIDMFVWDSADHVMERGQVGGESDAAPERVAFTATQDEYDIVVQIANGANTTYSLSAFMSDEIFDKPFELLDPITGQPVTTPIPDGSGGFVSPVDGTAIPPLALAPIDADDQIAGIGLGATEQFDSEQALRLGQSLRRTAAVSDPPSSAVLMLALVVAPFVLFAAGVVLMRRRHNVLF
jgi:hypothetical protein